MTFDQLAARQFSADTRVASLQLGCEDARMVGNCDTGSSCAYTNSLSWKDADTPLPKAIPANPDQITGRSPRDPHIEPGTEAGCGATDEPTAEEPAEVAGHGR